MKKILLTFSFLAIIAFAACTKTPYSPPANGGYVMFVNACYGSGSVLVSSKNNLTASEASSYPGSIPYLGNTKYQILPDGMDSIYFLLGAYDTLETVALNITDGNYFSVYVVGQLSKPSYFYTGDDFPPFIRGKAEIRFLNLSSDTGSKTATVGATVFSTGNIFYSVSYPVQIDTGSYTVTVGDDSYNNQVSLGPKLFAANKIYTVLLTGSSAGTGPALTLTVINNN